jgi:hypothetical protein
MERIKAIKLVDASRIARTIEFTRFPSPPEPEDPENEEGLLVRAADFIGQLGDPHYLRKANALWCKKAADRLKADPQQTDIQIGLAVGLSVASVRAELVVRSEIPSVGR